MKQRILDALIKLESTETIKILYACESGSRAWGFPSADSDYDVRFIYVRRPEWYLSIQERRDVIEVPISNDLDISGWDLKKALLLYRKSNPPLLEWLGSPIVYYEKTSMASRLRHLLPTFYSPIACTFHYLQMAKGNFRDYLRDGKVKLKKYFYVLRPLLAVKWIENDLGVVPTEFGVLVERLIDDTELKNVINGLIESKRAGLEKDFSSRIPSIHDFIESELRRLGEKANDYEKLPQTDVETLNKLFRDVLDETWNG